MTKPLKKNPKSIKHIKQRQHHNTNLPKSLWFELGGQMKSQWWPIGSLCKAEILLYSCSVGAALCSAHHPTSMYLLRCVSPSLHQGFKARSLIAIHILCPSHKLVQWKDLLDKLNPPNSCTLTTHITIYNVMNRVSRKQ